jgi:hypothetical protein
MMSWTTLPLKKSATGSAETVDHVTAIGSAKQARKIVVAVAESLSVPCGC